MREHTRMPPRLEVPFIGEDLAIISRRQLKNCKKYLSYCPLLYWLLALNFEVLESIRFS